MEVEKIKSTSFVEIGVILRLTEKEARALKAITEYGSKAFLETFYEHMGKSVLQPYEEGIIDLFLTIKEELPEHLRRADDARNIWRKAAADRETKLRTQK